MTNLTVDAKVTHTKIAEKLLDLNKKDSQVF